MTSSQPRSPELFHVAYLVTDIEQSRRKFEQVLGIEFHDPLDVDLVVETMWRPEPHAYRSRLCYSKRGPIFTELVEADDEEYKSITQGERIHHLGYWVEDVEAQRARQLAAGVRDEVIVRYPGSDKIRQWFGDPLTFHGVRVEYFDAGWRPEFEQWINNWGPDLASVRS